MERQPFSFNIGQRQLEELIKALSCCTHVKMKKAEIIVGPIVIIRKEGLEEITIQSLREKDSDSLCSQPLFSSTMDLPTIQALIKACTYCNTSSTDADLDFGQIRLIQRLWPWPFSRSITLEIE